MIAIVNYGMGNVGSIANMIRAAGGEPVITSEPDEMRAADGLILPGVGHFDRGMEALNASGLVPVLNELGAGERKPVLGICLGMQLMTRGSEEGTERGLGWVDAWTKRFPAGNGLKVPHMGWSPVRPQRENALIPPSEEEQRFYFVHSYYVTCDRPEDVVASAEHGVPFVAALQRDLLFGVQFHPEKSHRFGLALMQRFIAQC